MGTQIHFIKYQTEVHTCLLTNKELNKAFAALN